MKHYTENPELDAARYADEEEAWAEHCEKAAELAPGIVLKQLQEIKTATDWVKKSTFAGGNSADEILQWALSKCIDDVSDSYAEYMVSGNPEDREKMLKAMADWFAGIYGPEIYTDWLEAMQ